MGYYYTDASRESETTALPDVEIFDARAYSEITGADICGTEFEPGFYYAFGFPGGLWDSDPVGPFDTEEEALKEARETTGFYTSEPQAIVTPDIAGAFGMEGLPNTTIREPSKS